MGNPTINFDDLNSENDYNAQGAYGQSKLANLLFSLELNNRFKANGIDAMAVSAHPGWTLTGLQTGLMLFLSRLVGQMPDMGALPSLRAATGTMVEANDYYGPNRLREMRGYPVKVDRSAAAYDQHVAKRLWQVSEEMTQVVYQWSAEAVIA